MCCIMKASDPRLGLTPWYECAAWCENGAAEATLIDLMCCCMKVGLYARGPGGVKTAAGVASASGGGVKSEGVAACDEDSGGASDGDSAASAMPPARTAHFYFLLATPAELW